ncbi:hypothetical protein COU20_02460 [Candidatus Kaiserbacteria bacterium CG10_big_fil_rev_8_21_14_0_10_59_10]|uniref:UDP-N-acetylmuramoylalanine--D-glutamate ligase n=1 Tax=Candidatus Kaiserbacteria bacterium CG10_big_fil_rev_8_21_14_0_10_59_10 TaxID=1974612 RepID=A0A2H0U9R5_9BACT|nr:MAG: hypothetical protein COU20_02460 [Candidatus Kaiserbacteria bacterium CG10_big_fil_rev_8_21_14_0_10_59_10]
MKNACAPFQGKRIVLLGLGVLGRTVGDAEFLATCGAEVLVTDKKSEEELAESVARLKRYKNITFKLGRHDVLDFSEFDMVLKAAGVPLDSPEVAAAQTAGVPVCMSTALFAKHAAEEGATVVGVTGTRGKSTVAHMIYHALSRAALRDDSGRERSIFLGGNVRGVSTLSLLPKVKPLDIAVLELDSWQLQGFGTLGISPRIAVFTNLMPDHLDYYGGDMKAYFSDKANIFKHQRASDVLIAENGLLERFSTTSPGERRAPAPLPEHWILRVPGAHNRANAAYAAEALRQLGLSEEEIQSGLESFEGVEGRLQFVREVGGVKIYNDNNATTPEATIAALKALTATGGKLPTAGIVLILGGADKGLDMSALVAEVNKTCKEVVLLAGSGTDALLQATGYKLQAVTHDPFDSLERAVTKALECAEAGDVVLFSPAFASFGMFKHEYDRNDRFLSLVCSL